MVTEPDNHAAILDEYAQIIMTLADALGGPATGRDALPSELHYAYYEAMDRDGTRRFLDFLANRSKS